MLLEIKTIWKRSETDKQETTQHFMDVAHYRDYEKVMKGRGFTGQTVSVKDTVTGQEAQLDGNKITFTVR